MPPEIMAAIWQANHDVFVTVALLLIANMWFPKPTRKGFRIPLPGYTASGIAVACLITPMIIQLFTQSSAWLAELGIAFVFAAFVGNGNLRTLQPWKGTRGVDIVLGLGEGAYYSTLLSLLIGLVLSGYMVGAICLLVILALLPFIAALLIRRRQLQFV